MSAVSPQSARFRDRYGRLILFLVLSGLAGTVVLCGAYYLLFSSFLTRWDRLDPAPPGVVQLAAGTYSKVYVQTEAGQVFSCLPGTEECWIPDVVPADAEPAQPCEGNRPPFSWRANPPKERVSCVFVEGGFAEMSYQIYYVLDREGTVWEWETVGSAYEVLLLPAVVVVGCLGGLLSGSLIWAAGWLVRRRGGQARLSPAQIVILAFPWLCLAGAAVLWISITADRPLNVDPWQQPDQTAAAATSEAQLTEKASDWQNEATPSPQNPIYDLTEDLCAETWQLWPSSQPCPGDPDQPGAYAVTVDEVNLEGHELRGQTILFGMAPETEQFYKEYAPMEVPGQSRFRAQVGCLDGSTNCDLIFRLAIRRPDINYTTLGQWHQTYDGELEQIEVDLSAFAGQKVRLILTVYPYNQETSSEQSAAWFYPRIETR